MHSEINHLERNGCAVTLPDPGRRERGARESPVSGVPPPLESQWKGAVLSLEDLGNIGEFVAAVAVVISLIYLAIQIRQNTRSVRSATAQSASHGIIDINSLLVGDRSITELLLSGSRAPEELDPVDQTRYLVALSSLFVTFETMFLQQRSGLIEPEYWESRERFLRFLLSFPGVVSWWRRSSALYGDQFRQYVESQIQ